VSHPAIGRFFSIRQTLISIGVFLGGAGILGLVYYTYLTGGRIPILLPLLGGALILGSPVLFIGTAFPKGCKTCRKVFESSNIYFPTGWDQGVKHFLTTGDQPTWQQLCSAPAHDQTQRVAVEIEHCTKCCQIGRVRLTVEEKKEHWLNKSSEDWIVLQAAMLGWLLQIGEARAKIPQYYY
jgi:hypothetical protein